MILLNIAIRYPIDHPLPHGSDTLALLDFSRHLESDGTAGWILSPLSYVGMFPLSYPGGMSFMYAEYVMLTDQNWNSVPWVFGSFFSIILVLAGFMLFRIFRMSDRLSAILAGLLAMSPFFLYITYGQASTRGFLIPIMVICLFLLLWQVECTKRRVFLFVLFTIASFAIHRTALVVTSFELVAGLVYFMGPYFVIRSTRARRVAFAAMLSLGVFVILWPFIPGLREVYLEIPEVSSAFLVGEAEFQTGYFLEGESVFVLLVNLASNYVGSIGLVILILPFTVVALLVGARESSCRDTFLLSSFIIFAFLIWKVQYVQLLFAPFFFIAAGLAIERIGSVRLALRPISRRIPTPPQARRLWRALRPSLSAVSVSLLILFSLGMLAQRGTVVEANTNQLNWPSSDTVNTGIYVGQVDCDDHTAFVSNAGMLDRRIRWFSGWDTPVTDAPLLLVSGYLNANSTSFSLAPDMRGDYLSFLTTFYKLDRVYVLSSSVPDRELYDLSMIDTYGLLRLYFKDPSSSYVLPKVSYHDAGIGLVVEMNSLGSEIRNPFTHEGTVNCGFLSEVASETYVVFRVSEYSTYLTADVR